MSRKWIWAGLAAALLLAALSFIASGAPDGLERVAKDQHFDGQGHAVHHAPMAEYVFPGIRRPWLSGALAGIAGVLLLFLLGIGLAFWLRKR